MKKTLIILLSLLMALLPACTKKETAESVPTAQVTTSVPSLEPVIDTPASPTDEPAATDIHSDLPMVYNVYDEVGLSISEAEMFRYDIDGDGNEEVISFRLDDENYLTTILIDDQSLQFDSPLLEEVILIDLDPATPWINLLVEIDWASSDFYTTEVHLENGKPVKGAEIEAVSVSDGKQLMLERTDLLGTRFASRGFHGETLEPDSDWLDVTVPSEEELRKERADLIEYGRLYHTVKEIPCLINGKSAKIAKDSYIYLTRFNPSEGLAEVRTLDGVTAVLEYNYDADSWSYLIAGVPQDGLFDNLFYSD